MSYDVGDRLQRLFTAVAEIKEKTPDVMRNHLQYLATPAYGMMKDEGGMVARVVQELRDISDSFLMAERVLWRLPDGRGIEEIAGLLGDINNAAKNCGVVSLDRLLSGEQEAVFVRLATRVPRLVLVA